MMLPLDISLQIVTIFFTVLFVESAENNKAPIASVFEAFGYSPACVASALTSCEFSTKRDFSVNVVDLIEVINSLLQEMKSGRENERKNNDAIWGSLKNVTDSLSIVKSFVQKAGDHLTNPRSCFDSVDRSSNIDTSLAEIQSVVLEIKEEMKGTKRQNYLKNCFEYLPTEDFSSRVRVVYPYVNNTDRHAVVLCDQTNDGGGWTVIQNRDALPVRERFERTWLEYVHGFGDLNGEFWLGLENIHALTSSAQMELHIYLEDYEGEKRYAKYEIFHVGDAASKYVLTIGNYSGDAGDSLASPVLHISGHLNGIKFSTHDQDNDLNPSRNCAKDYRGAWWYNDCHYAALNGFQYFGKHEPCCNGINWVTFRGSHYSYKKASMKIRPVLN